MSRASLMGGMMQFIGYPLNTHIDAIKAIAARNHFRVLVIGPDAAPNIDNEEDRLNVRQDKDGKILSFSIG